MGGLVCVGSISGITARLWFFELADDHASDRALRPENFEWRVNAPRVKVRFVAQIFNLLYRRIVFCRAMTSLSAWENSDGLP